MSLPVAEYATLPQPARVVERVQETHTVFTLRLEFCDSRQRESYQFRPGQFNMVYLHGVGEVPISIVSDPDHELLDHTIRAVGRVTKGLSKLRRGDVIALRGPYGRGWPLQAAQGRDVAVITGGLGCAPVISVINYISERREQYGRLLILQGVKLPKDLVWRDRYEAWIADPKTDVFLAADRSDPDWPWHVGLVTELFDEMVLQENTIAMMCGPEGMMRACVHELLQRKLRPSDIYLSMERSMKCALGHCGHCQYGGRFVCRDGPVFPFSEIEPLFKQKGF